MSIQTDVRAKAQAAKQAAAQMTVNVVDILGNDTMTIIEVTA